MMKKLLASVMVAVILSSFIYIDFPGRAVAKSTESEVENAIYAAIQWKNENDNPLDNAGKEASDIYVTALARGGIDFDYDRYLNELDSIVKEYSKSTNAFDMQRVLMTVIASGGDGQYIGGKDLVANATYFKEDLGYSGVLEYIYALILLNSGDFEIPEDWAYNTYEDMIHAILASQNEDGSFGDVYTTAAAIIALSTYNNNYEYSFTAPNGEIINESGGNAIYKAVKFLSEQQSEYGDFYTATDTALVAMAIDSIGLKENDVRFIKNNNTIMDGLLTFRDAGGGFTADYNEVDSLSTSYAICALISNMRVRGDKADFFDFTTFDSIDKEFYAGSPSTSKPDSTTGPKATLKVIKTIAPKVTSKPKVTVKPKTGATPTIRPTEKPDLVGPVRLVGPEAPIETFMPSESILPLNKEISDTKTLPVILSVICVFALVSAMILMVFKNKIIKPRETKERAKKYKAKSHRKTEERRKFENRRKYNERRKYKGNRR